MACDCVEYDSRMIALTRNVESLFINLRLLEQQRAAQNDHIVNLQNTVADLTMQVQNLTQRIAVLTAQVHNGPVLYGADGRFE